MKKSLFYLFMLMAVAVMPLTSCEKNNDEPDGEEEQYDPTSDDDQRDFSGYDALEWLQGSIVVVNSDNEVIRRIIGKPLDESQPTIISIPVNDLADAEDLFLSWVAPTKEATKVDGGYDYSLTDAEGKDQGSVSFRSAQGESGVLARMDVAEGTDLKQVSEVNFIEADLWPENTDETIYRSGQIYWRHGYKLKWSQDGWERPYLDKKPETTLLRFYCIQGYDTSNEAILVWLCPDDGESLNHPKLDAYAEWTNTKYLPTDYLPSLAEAQKVLDFYNANGDKWDAMLEEMDEEHKALWSPQYFSYGSTGNSEFVLGVKQRVTVTNDYLTILDLDKELIDFDGIDEGEICEVGIRTTYKYRYMQILTYRRTDL